MAQENGSQPGRATIRDIASQAGVSIATVSRVMNGRPDVSRETREAVLQVVRSRNFTANRSARGLSAGRTGLIGFTIPILHAEYFTHILSGAAEALYEQDLRLVVCPTLHEHDREVTLLDHLMHGTTDGAILLLPSESSEELKSLHAHSYPFVVVDPRERLDEGIPAVSAAHWSGAKAAMDHLIGLGHRRIAAVTGFTPWVASTDRLNAYHAALAANGLPVRPEYVQEADFLIEGGYRATREILDLPIPIRPTAIFAFNDNMAIGAMQAARERGMRVPHDLSIVGFDDSDPASIVSPPLTTVRQPLAEMGRVGVSLLTRLLDGQRVEALRVELEAKLVVRESTAPPAEGRP